MKSIPCIGNEVLTTEMGFTLIHEHLMFQFSERFKEKSIEFTRSELKRFSENGGKTLVDLTPFRNIRWYEEINQGTDLNLICCTGYYLEDWVDREAFKLRIKDHAELMAREIREGIDGSGVKAGIIKVAANNAVLNQWEENIFTAAAMAQVKTKTPIATHACTGAGEQQKVLLNAGADPEHIFFSHVEAEFGWEGRGLKEEAAYLLEIVKKGSYLLFNNFGFEFDTPKEDLLYILKFLSDKGFLNKILISVDMNYQVNEKDGIVLEAADKYPECARRIYSYSITDILPVLREAGFGQSDIDTIFIKNPARFFDYL